MGLIHLSTSFQFSEAAAAHPSEISSSIAVRGLLSTVRMKLVLLSLVLAFAACNDRSLPPPGPSDGAADLARSDLAARPDLASPADQGGNACEAAGGYCDPGDFTKPTCKSGYHEDQPLESDHPQVCGLGICCVPDATDCRTTGCSPGSSCSACLGANGVEYVCISDGAAC